MKIHACGLCHSDVSGVNGTIPYPLPCVLGHEGAGILEAAGPGSVWKTGDRAILTLVHPCNRCSSCLAARPSLCTTRSKFAKGRVTDKSGKRINPFIGLGCMADYAVVSDFALVRAPDNMPLNMGALVSCGVTTGAGASMNRAKIQPGSSCCVVGCGGVGLSAIQGARICGAKQIIAVDTLDFKLSAAKKFGATHTVNAKDVPDAVKEVMKLSNGGTDYGLEAVGSATTAKLAIDVIKPGGLGVIVGVAPQDADMTMKVNYFLSEKMVTGSTMGSSVPANFVPLLCDLYKKGDLLLDELVSKYYPIKEAPTAFDDLAKGGNLRGVFAMHELSYLVTDSSSKL